MIASTIIDQASAFAPRAGSLLDQNFIAEYKNNMAIEMIGSELKSAMVDVSSHCCLVMFVV